MSSKILLLLFACLFSMAAFAQRTVTGKVTDAKDGSPVVGATVTAKGTNRSTQTDANGSFSLSVAEGAKTLTVSSVGFEARDISITDGEISVGLSTANQSMSEVVVIGYGTARKRDLTGAVSSVKAKDFNQGVQVSPDQLVQGKVAGVQVTNNSGQPGGATTIRIRGNSSLAAGSQPLFVIDGVIVDGSTPRPGLDVAGFGGTPGGNPLAFINPEDIASIDILKDASATAIYGSRGSNGVVIVNTKRGASGQPSVDATFSTGFSKILRKIEVLDAAEYRQALTKYNLTSGDFGGNSDAYDAILQTGMTRNASLGVSGGVDAAKFRVSVGYLDQEGILKNSNYKKLTAGINSQFKLTKSRRVGLDFSLLGSRQDEDLAAISSNSGFTGNVLSTALQFNPTRPLRKPDGSINNYFDGATINPLEFVEGFRDNVRTSNIVASISPSLRITDQLEFRTTYAINAGFAERRSSVSSFVNLENNGITTTHPQGRGRAVIGNGDLTTQTLNHVLNYRQNVSEDLAVNALLGYEFFRKDNRGSSLNGRDFAGVGVDYTDALEAGANAEKRFSSYRSPVEELQSYFARAGIDYKGKYLLTATIRRDGSSKFGENNKYGWFPSFSAAWNINQEDFFEGASSTFNTLKLRAGWGITGNQEFPAGASLRQYTFNDNGGGVSLSQLPNPDLQWQEDAQFNVGLDFGFLNSRISGSIDFFNRTTNKLLFPGVAPQPGPSARLYQNLDAEIINKGVEAAINATIVKTAAVTWDLGVNATFIKNEVKNLIAPVLTGTLFGQGTSGAQVQIITNGQPVNSFYGLQFTGLDKDGFSTFTGGGNEYFMLGNPNPEVILGINTSVAYKKLSFSASMNGAFGHQIYNNTLHSVLPLTNLGTRNIAKSILDAGENAANALQTSSRYLESGNFLKLANATLSYNFGKVGSTFNNLGVFVTGQNLFVLTDYTGFDPEVNTVNSSNGINSVGIDYIGFPTARTFLFGVRTNF